MPNSKFPEHVKRFIAQSNIRLRRYIARFDHMSRKDRRKIAIASISAIALCFLAVFLYVQNIAYAVKVDGKMVGIVREKEDFSKIVETMQSNLHRTYNREIVLNQIIVYEKTRAKKKELTKADTLRTAVKEMMHFQVKAFGIKADDKVIVAVSTKEEAQKVLGQVQDAYTGSEENTYAQVSFGEKVEIAEIDAEFNQIKTPEEALKMIQQGTDEIKAHEVQSGESFWSIAKKYGLKVEELQSANPGVNPEKLQLKQKINLLMAKPLLTVATVEKVRYDEKIPREIVLEDTSALYKGDKKIKVEGKDGEREVFAEVIRQNGVEVERKILEEKIISQPEKQVVLQGTKPKPLTVATGSFSNPARGRLTSRFGWRWGRNHDGIDVAAKIGTPIYAADGGTVSFSGTQSGYGKVVIINHGNGLQTVYGHNSKNVVSKGDKVYKGQKIAEVGNTGRSTGPHVHFEVRKNGKAVNPLSYVKY